MYSLNICNIFFSISFLDSTEMDSIEQAKTARECFRILKKMKLFTSNDVIIVQFLLKETHCRGLFEKCIKYAEANGAVHYKPATHPGNLFFLQKQNYKFSYCIIRFFHVM